MANSVLISTLIIFQVFLARGSSDSISLTDNLFKFEPKDDKECQSIDSESPSERIVGGQTVNSVTRFPFQALITSTWSGGLTKTCGGALVSATEVLTTATCVTSPLGSATSARVDLGAYDRNNANEPGRVSFTLGPTSYGIHPYFKILTNSANYAVLKLPSAVNINARINTIEIANPTDSYVGQTASVIGWGWNGTASPRFPQSFTGRIIPNEQCATLFTGVKYSNVCIFSRGVTCDGDEGSPLTIVGPNNQRFLVGIASVVPRILCALGKVSVFAGFSSEEE